jgi:membrane complex biogenesis BtpA family protein
LGVVHLRALPGAPLFQSIDEVIDSALYDVRALAEGGVDGFVVENFGDRPFFKNRVPAETIAAMTRVVAELARAVSLPFGVNVLRNDARAALAVAAATGAAFIRVNVLAGTFVADQGILEGEAAETMRLRAALCPRVLVFADHMVKHAAPLGAVNELQAARDLRHRALADAIVISGAETGAPADPARLRRLREAMPDVPLVVGSGLTADNAAQFADADAAIAGTSVKRGGAVDAPVDRERVARLVAAFRPRVAR